MKITYINVFKHHDNPKEDSIFSHQCTNFMGKETGEERVDEALESQS